jgi:hypothetical protein
MIISSMSKLFFFFFKNDVKYYIINCITTFQNEKQHWKQFRKRKRFQKRLLSAGSGSAGSESAGSGSAGSGSAESGSAGSGSGSA